MSTKAKPPKNQGEGDVEAARRYNEDQKRFVESGAVPEAAKRAEPETNAEADDLRAAEDKGRKQAKGEDPTVPGANARTKIKVGRRV
jgi:hypothetical protein